MSDTFPYVEHKVRVRFAETDAQGVVYYANYLVWFEVARMEWMRAHGISWQALGELNRQLIVAHAELDYRASARYDDELRLRVFVQRVGNKSLTFGYEIYRLPDETLLTTGNTVLVCVTMAGEPMPVPDIMREPLVRDLAAREALSIS
ncbi:MAG: acyl-CoA thioesterase [Ardenticatenales bacterium]|nr:acyl-CoA thioesterase [Ardenticatenales bacterium]